MSGRPPRGSEPLEAHHHRKVPNACTVVLGLEFTRQVHRRVPMSCGKPAVGVLVIHALVPPWSRSRLTGAVGTWELGGGHC
jgi:hypothetical protein